ncbi:hypothetical protein DRE_04106 [Drechslerella stenobrocha 248]|uniref:GATA-type domain-containing protein n=1 Tax=Drechslerella stenobrocha 248 TaxID=1043628 RepID=W7HTD7_9PEZI|nr:hypothetical protein DRE_04106 [Drechslerella stenobrocha 248]
MGSSSENERRKSSDTLPPLGYPRYERPTHDDHIYSPHRQNQGNAAVITPTSPTTRYASPLSSSSALPKPQPTTDYTSPPESRRTSGEDVEARGPGAPRPVNLPSLPSLNQMIDALPPNYAPSSIVSTGSAAPPGPPPLGSAGLPSSLGSRPFSHPRPLHETEQPPPPRSIGPIGSQHSSPTSNLPPPSSSLSHDKPGSHSRTATPSHNNPLSFSNGRDISEAHGAYNNVVKGSPRSQSGPSEHPYSRPPPSTYYAHGYEQNHTPYEHPPYAQVSPHGSGFPPPPPPPPPTSHSSGGSVYQSGNISGGASQSFPGQAAALFAYQQRGGPYGNEPAGHPDPSYSPKGKSVGGKTSFQDTYGSAINRALDISELRRELDLIRDNASHLYHFSTQYTPQGGQVGGFQALKYSGQIEPSIQALDDAINITHRILEALEYWRNKVVNDQSRKHEQQANPVKPMPKRSIEQVDDDMGYTDDMRAGLHSDPKKQRKGKAAPPGRCHSCNRAETPEWRRGPDGARTLCNACGLHYAKLTRKLNKNPQSIGPSPLARKPASATLM